MSEIEYHGPVIALLRERGIVAVEEATGGLAAAWRRLTCPPERSTPMTTMTCDNGIPDCDLDCHGCGRHDSCGMHYPDCGLLEDGDWVVPRPAPGQPLPTEDDATPYGDPQQSPASGVSSVLAI